MATTEQSYGFTTDGYEGFPTTIGYELSSVGGGLVMSSANETHSMKSQLAAYDILIPLLGTLIIITNGAVVISSGLLLKKGQQPRCTYLLLGNVAMADLITGIAVIVGQAYPKTNRTHYSCAFQLGMIVSSTIASIYSVGLIAVDRFLYILYGLKYHRWVYPTRARCMIAATWLLGLVIGYLPLMGWAGDTQNGKICWFIMMAPPNLIILTTIVGVSPVFLVIVLYSIILYNAIKKVIQLNKIGKENGESDGHNSSNLRMFRGGASAAAKKPTVKTIQEEAIETSEEKEDRAAAVEESSETKPERSRMRKILDKVKGIKREDEESQQQPDKNQPNKWKAIKVVFFTTGSFVCTWLPYFVACSAYVFCDFHESPQRCQKLKYAIASPLAILGFLNSLLNPVIYAWWHNGFRKGIKKLCCRKRNAANMAIGQKAASSSSSNRPTSSQTFKPNSSTG